MLSDPAASSQAAPTGAAVPGSAPADLRSWLDGAKELGELHEVTAPVSWDHEMAAITYLRCAQGRDGDGRYPPALLFTNIIGYPGHAALWNLVGSSARRLALSWGLPTEGGEMELVRHVRDRLDVVVPPTYVESSTAPVFEHSMTGDDIDVLRFPVPKHWPLDGGRYAGTGDLVITRDPDTGVINAGTYRMMVHDSTHVGLHLSPGKDARPHIEKCWAKGAPAEVVACWGIAPSWFIMGSHRFPSSHSELDHIGGLIGRPMELVQGRTTSLPIPAHAEIVIEGLIHPDAFQQDGPFGEFMGYYGAPSPNTYVVEVTAIHHRSSPVMTNALMADTTANECGMLYAVGRSAGAWSDLDRLGVAGVRGVWAYPSAASGLGMTVVSVDQQYAGHSAQVLALVAQCPSTAYFNKWVVAVDGDVAPNDIDQVLWAMSTRCDAAQDVDLLRQTYSTKLDPSMTDIDERPYSAKVLINACKDYRRITSFPARTAISASAYHSIRDRWEDLGFAGLAPEPSLLEPDPPS